jgi:hypothetical protein
MQPHDALGIDQYVTTDLIQVTGRLPQLAAFQQEPDVRAPRCRSKDIPIAFSLHAVSAIQFARLVDQQRPIQLRLSNVVHANGTWPKRDHGDANVPSLEFVFVLSQLRQVLAARQSTQMAMEHQQQPMPAVVCQSMKLAVRIGQFESNGRCSFSVVHDLTSPGTQNTSP